MDAVERRHAEILEPNGDTLVGGEHELFDEAVGPGALGAGDAAHLAVLVELDDRLGQIEVDRSALFAALVHQHGESFHPFKALPRLRVLDECVGLVKALTRSWVLVEALPRFCVLVENRGDRGVGHARGGADDAFDDLEALNAALRVELHDAAQDEAVFVRSQAADIGRELLRQHGDGAIGEVDAGAAQAGFEIERGVGKNVLGHVGDVDLEFISSIGAIGDENRVIEILSGLAIDGDDGQGAEVCAVGG